MRQWVSSNPAVASGSTNGTVKAQRSGKAVISALTTAGQVLRCTVTVKMCIRDSFRSYRCAAQSAARLLEGVHSTFR